jgi:hypothetical protein
VRVDAAKGLIALDVGLIAAELPHAERFLTAMAVLMEVPDTPPRTGGRVDPAKNTANKVIQQVLSAAIADPRWRFFELTFHALTPPQAEERRKGGHALDAFVLVTAQSVATYDPGNYLHPVLSACAPRLTTLRKQLAAKPK